VTTKSKLDALGDALGVTDDTRDIERPKSGRGLASVLGDKMVVDDDPPEAEAAFEQPPNPTPAAASPADKRESSSPRRLRTDATHSVSPSKKTSATIPVSLVQRLRDAKQKRWDLPRLVSDALSAGSKRVSLSSAEEFLEHSAHEPRAISSFRMPADDLNALDRLGVEWRMNRSQVLSAMLDRQLSEIGF